MNVKLEQRLSGIEKNVDAILKRNEPNAVTIAWDEVFSRCTGEEKIRMQNFIESGKGLIDCEPEEVLFIRDFIRKYIPSLLA
jgi:hypothetical protein